MAIMEGITAAMEETMVIMEGTAITIVVRMVMINHDRTHSLLISTQCFLEMAYHLFRLYLEMEVGFRLHHKWLVWECHQYRLLDCQVLVGFRLRDGNNNHSLIKDMVGKVMEDMGKAMGMEMVLVEEDTMVVTKDIKA